ncbi:MAG TPA: right-handed parallel beta-helix repeat-containing protein [Thermoanaerobaculia bacterium]
MKRILSCAALLLLASVARAEIVLSVGPIERATAGTHAIVDVVLTNTGATSRVVSELTIGIEGQPRTATLSLNGGPAWPCNPAGRAISCGSSNQTISGFESVRFPLSIDPAHEGIFDVTARVTWRTDNGTSFLTAKSHAPLARRVFRVTNTANDGTGSLRQALFDVQASCVRDDVPCRIEFHIEDLVSDETVPVIRLFSALPELTFLRSDKVHLEIDASTQTSDADSVASGAAVAIDGSAVAAGHGLAVSGVGYLFIRGLSISGFPANGLEIDFISEVPSGLHEHRQVSAIVGNVIGSNAAATVASPNGGRGISIRQPTRQLLIAENVISGNRRSGIFLEGGSDIEIRGNTIGEGSDDLPLPNGASGIYLGPEASSITIAGNRVAHNADFGIAVSRSARSTFVGGNSFHRNGILPIDVGLDGFDGHEFYLETINFTEARIPPPQITSVDYDAATGTTTVRGGFGGSGFGWARVFIYSNHTPSIDGQLFLGETTAGHEFTLTIPLDLRGMFLTAHGTQNYNIGFLGNTWTSEFTDVPFRVPAPERRRAVR